MPSEIVAPPVPGMRKHRPEISKHKLGVFLAIVGLFMWKICLNNRFKSFGELFGAILV